LLVEIGAEVSPQALHATIAGLAGVGMNDGRAGRRAWPGRNSNLDSAAPRCCMVELGWEGSSAASWGAR
jgi:hypothetical protein